MQYGYREGILTSFQSIQSIYMPIDKLFDFE